MKCLSSLVIAGFFALVPAFAEVSIHPDTVQLQGNAGNGIINHGGTNGAGQAAVLPVRMEAMYSMRTLSTAQSAALAAGAGRPNPSAAKARIQAMGDTAIGVLRRTDIREEERQREFRRLLQNNFQVHAIGALALGRHRASATPRQRKEFDKLFSEFVLIRVSELLDDYANETFKVNDVIDAGKRDVAVRSRIVPERGETTEVYWVMREFNGRPQIIDVRVDNISLVITQRDEFNSVIQREGVDALLHRLRNQVNRHATAGTP